MSDGRKLGIAADLLALAEDRGEGMVDAGQIAETKIVETERAVLLRRSAAVSAERDLQAARLDLSLVLRDTTGSIVQAGRTRLPEFPDPEKLQASAVEQGLRTALQRRPEIAGVLWSRSGRTG
ncbi:MAG: hypothetical protein OXN89_25580 [Bryobacterales bacterium]|nr:hypothetical protein [Bryobacterales bacterium]